MAYAASYFGQLYELLARLAFHVAFLFSRLQDFYYYHFALRCDDICQEPRFDDKARLALAERTIYFHYA